MSAMAYFIDGAFEEANVSLPPFVPIDTIGPKLPFASENLMIRTFPIADLIQNQ
jgi:hypothetical protein